MRVTTRDIAKEAGVSQTTVSLVLNNNTEISISSDTRARVIKAAERMGYQPRRHATNRSKARVVGLLVPCLSNLYYPFLVQELEEYARAIGITVVLQNTLRSPDTEAQSIKYFRSIGAGGILCLYSPKCPLPKDIPSLVIGERQADTEVNTVCLNSYVSGQIAAEHLLELGHRSIAFISTPLSNLTGARQLRMEGAKKVLSDAGLENRFHLLTDDAENELAGSNYEFNCGARLTEQLLQENPGCTAIIAVNDMTALGCMDTLRRHGLRIPEDMAICGFDNLWVHRLTAPELTSVDQMAFNGCKVGLSVLMEKMNAPLSQDEPIFLEYKPRLYARGSTVRAD